jgi:zinc/manganese transport system substrate-binding protein
MIGKGYAFVALALAGVLAGGPAAAQDKGAEKKIKVVATFSILDDLVKNVGRDRVEITTLVGRNSDAHVYSPSPSDAKLLADANVVFTNGFGFEGWITRLIKASGPEHHRPARLAIGGQRQDLRRQYP